MDIIKAYWEHISKRLAEDHPENKLPAEWTAAEVESFSKHKLSKKISETISHGTIRRVFKKGEEGSLDTKDKFARYFGYDTHGDYINQEIKVKKSKEFLWLLLPLGLMLLIGMILYSRKSVPLSTKPAPINTKQILDVVEKSVHSQFDAFKAIPNYEPYLDSLKELYDANGSAYHDILDVLTGQSGLDWTINNTPNSSTAKLLDKKLDTIIGTQAIVSTRERWRLDWFNRSSQRYEYGYEATNTQKYVLHLDTLNNQWKITQNEFTGNKFRYIPRYIDCSKITDKTQTLSIVKQSARKAIENDGLDLALKTLECFYQKETTPKSPNQLSLLLAKKTELLRAVNTDLIEKEEFETKKDLLFKEILAHLDQL